MDTCDTIAFQFRYNINGRGNSQILVIFLYSYSHHQDHRTYYYNFTMYHKVVTSSAV